MTELDYKNLQDKLKQASDLKSSIYLLKSCLKKIESNKTTVYLEYEDKKGDYTRESVPSSVHEEVLDCIKLSIKTKLAQLEREFLDL